MLARILAIVAILATIPAAAETVTFTADDGVEVTADVYLPDNVSSSVLVLFHMAGASRGEYREIAPRMAKQGYISMAVDQRSGGAFAGVVNLTAAGVGSSCCARPCPSAPTGAPQPPNASARRWTSAC